MKIQEIAPGKYAFYCFGCQELHQFDNTWSYNNDPEKPIVYPCLTLKEQGKYKCRLYIYSGYLYYYDNVIFTPKAIERGPLYSDVIKKYPHGMVKMIDVLGPKPTTYFEMSPNCPDGQDATSEFRIFTQKLMDEFRKMGVLMPYDSCWQTPENYRLTNRL